MNSKSNFSKKTVVRAVLCVVLAVFLFSAGIGIGHWMHRKPEASEPAGYASNPARILLRSIFPPITLRCCWEMI